MVGRPLYRLGLSLVAIVASGLPVQAHAAPEAGARIVVTYDARSAEQRSALAAVRAHISGLAVSVVLEPMEREHSLTERLALAGRLATTHQALGTFSIELAADGAFLVYFTEPDGRATLVRRLPPGPDGQPVAIEQAAIVVRSLVEALLEGGHLGVSSASSEEAGKSLPATVKGSPSGSEASESAERSSRAATDAALPASSADPARETSFFLALGYAGTTPGLDSGWLSGFSLGARWHSAGFLYAGARYTLFPATRVVRDVATVSVARHPIELLLGYAGHSWLTPSAELGLLLDSTTRETERAASPFEPAAPETRWGVALGARVGVSFAPWSALRLGARAGADFWMTRWAYVVEDKIVLEPASVRPKLEFDVAVGVW